jgi:membrane-associated PAP2 superfamily phosphatase
MYNVKKEEELRVLVKHLMLGRIEGKRRLRRRKQLLDDLKEKRMYWNLIAGALDSILWITWFVRGCGSIARETTQRMT